MKTKTLITEALFAAIIAVFSVITISIGPVPITLSIFAIYLAAVILGGKKSTVSLLVYILCGAVGIPVFSGMRGGISVLFGPTGGYILSYIFITLIAGFSCDKLKNKPLIFLMCLLSLFVCYAGGTIQYILITNTPLQAALVKCVYPFIAFDIIKIIAALFIGMSVKKRLVFLDL